MLDPLVNPAHMVRKPLTTNSRQRGVWTADGMIELSEPTVPGSTYVGYCLQGLQRCNNGIAFSHGDTHLTGRDALSMVYRMSYVLRERGLLPGRGISVLSGNRPEAFLLQVAAQLAGARHTGLHGMASVDDQAFVLEDSQTHTFVYDPRSYAVRGVELMKNASPAQIFSLGPGPVGEDLLQLASGAHDADGSLATPESIASIFYTGGTTGRSKGVIQTQASSLFVALLAQANWEWPATPTLLLASAITHAAGQLIGPTLALGGRVVLLDKFDAGNFLRVIEQERVSVTFLVPTMIYTLLDHEDIAKRDTSSLLTVVYGASPIDPHRLREALDRFGPVLTQGYGQTESGVGSLVLSKADHVAAAEQDGQIPTGRAPAGIEVSIRDERDEPVGVGFTGEICLRGSTIMAGYWNQPDLTSEVLHDGWLHTGDVGFQDERGYVTLVERKKDMIVSGGYNVYPREIEDVLTSHPAVQSAAVVGIPDDKWGEAVHALVVGNPQEEVDTAVLIKLVRDKKGPINTPKSIEWVESLPQTALGKIDKAAIRQRYWLGQERGIH
jgi:fatty-acyl-CoA synthase